MTQLNDHEKGHVQPSPFHVDTPFSGNVRRASHSVSEGIPRPCWPALERRDETKCELAECRGGSVEFPMTLRARKNTLD